MTKVTYLSLLLLSCVATSCCFTNLDFFNAIKDHVTDMKIDYDGPSCDRLDDSEYITNDRTLDDDIIDIPGAPTDEFDSDFFLKEIGFIPYESADQCESDTSQDDEDSLKVVSKYCHYEQYLTSGLQDTDIFEQDQASEEDEDGRVQCHHYKKRKHRKRIFARCKCKRRRCSCCLGRIFRFNHCTHRRTFYMKACIVIKYKGKKPCITTTTTQASTTTSKKSRTVAPPITTAVPTPPPNEEYQNADGRLQTCPERLYDVTFEVNGRKVYKYCATTDYLKPLCYTRRASKGKIKACMEFYSVNTRTGRVCVKFTGKWTIGCRHRKLSVKVGCMKLPKYNKADLLDVLTNGVDWEGMPLDEEM
ncbi:hypothetical protein ACF0H5_012850 [Mactra antiquata]